MTERKPPGMTFTSWIDQQIHEAMERGAFDNLPGAGKPIPDRGDEDAAQAWLREYLRREGVSTDELLPTPLKLRKEIARLTATVPTLGSEIEVREAVAELNRQIMEWRRIPLGPPIFVPLVDEDAMLSRWREGQPRASPASSGSNVSQETTSPQPARSRWRRRSRRGDRGRSGGRVTG
jgi:hypothetical protein